MMAFPKCPYIAVVILIKAYNESTPRPMTRASSGVGTTERPIAILEVWDDQVMQ